MSTQYDQWKLDTPEHYDVPPEVQRTSDLRHVWSSLWGDVVRAMDAAVDVTVEEQCSVGVDWADATMVLSIVIDRNKPLELAELLERGGAAARRHLQQR